MKYGRVVAVANKRGVGAEKRTIARCGWIPSGLDSTRWERIRMSVDEGTIRIDPRAANEKDMLQLDRIWTMGQLRTR